jgi:hypothetical protein
MSNVGKKEERKKKKKGKSSREEKRVLHWGEIKGMERGQVE